MGFFITLEGIEGSGKSTQAELLKGHLESKAAGRSVIALREPGGTPLGEKVRAILLDSSEDTAPDAMAELLLYEACRAQLVSRVIRPALERGDVVICDRFTDSTLAYQGQGRGLDLGVILRANSLATSGLAPDLTIIIDCQAEVGLKRALARIEAATGPREDRFEREEIGFHERVRDGFLKIAEDEPERVKVVDGSGEIPLIHKEICDIIDRVGSI